MATELDPSIIAQAQQIGDPARLLTLAKMSQELRATQQKAAGQNALRQLFASPGAIDAQGNPTPQTIQKTMQVDPETGMELRQQTLDQQVKAAQAKHYETTAGQQKFDFLSGTAGIATDAYKAAKDAGRSDQDAISAATAARNEALKNNGGVLGDQDASAAMASPFDPVTAKTFAMANPDYAKRIGDTRKEANTERQEGERERHDMAVEDRMAAGQDQGSRTPYEEKDTKDAQGNVIPGRALSFDKKTGRYYDTDGNVTTPGKVEKIGGGGGAQQPQIDMNDPHDKEYIQAIANYDLAPPSKGRNPEYSKKVMESVLSMNPDYQEGDYANRQTAKRAFNTGKQGDTTRSLNVSVAHLGVLDELGKALDNGDTKAFNAIGNRLADQFGDERPNDFNMAKIIVGDEVEKAVKAGVGTGEERASLQAKFGDANSPKALAGVIRIAKKLLGGQLNGLEKQYETSTGAKDFRNKLFPETVEELGGGKTTKGGSTTDHSKMSDDELKKALGLP